MAYVIAEPCIGTKDTACVDSVCPVDCIHPAQEGPTDREGTSSSSLSIPRSASIAARAFRFAR